MKTTEEINEINLKRRKVFVLLAEAAAIMGETGCSLGEDTIIEAVRKLIEDNCHEY